MDTKGEGMGHGECGVDGGIEPEWKYVSHSKWHLASKIGEAWG